jgi:chromosome segregation ATPase
MQERLQEAELTLQYKTRRLEDLEKTHKSCAEKINNLQDKVNNLEGSQIDGNLRNPQLQSSSDRLKAEVAGLRAQLSAAQQEREDCVGKLNEMEVTIERLKKSLKVATDGKQAAEKQLQDVNESLASRTAKLAQVEAGLKQKTEKVALLTSEKAELLEKLASAANVQEMVTQALGAFFKSTQSLGADVDKILRLAQGYPPAHAAQHQAEPVVTQLDEQEPIEEEEVHFDEPVGLQEAEDVMNMALPEEPDLIPFASGPLPSMEMFDFGPLPVVDDPCEFTFEL